MLEKIFSNERLDGLVIHSPTDQMQFRLPSLEEVLGNQYALPAYSLLLGLCDDGLPLVLDLTDPEAGSFLVTSDSGFDNTTLLHSVLSAAFLTNTEKEVNIHLISPYTDDLLHFHRQPCFKISFEPYRPECAIVLEEMVNLVMQRQKTGEIQPVHLLVIDGMDLLWQALSPQARMHLDWLVEYGPQVGLWVVASIESTYLDNRLAATVSKFPSRILGRISQPNLARFLSGLNHSYLFDLKPGLQFFVRTGGQSFTVWLLQSDTIYASENNEFRSVR